MKTDAWLYRTLLALVAVAVPLLASCGAPEQVGELDRALFANDKAAYDFFVGKGLTNFQAAGIVGNLDQESGVNPNAVQNGGPGRGIAQWSVGGRWDTTKNGNVIWYAKTKGMSPYALGLQLDFIWYELTTFGYGFAQLKATTNVTDATIVFMTKYEICGQCNSAQRVANAKAVLNAYGMTTAPAYKATFVSQSWPLANTPLTIKCGEDVPAHIVLRNAGAKTWDSNTKLGTTQPRDRSSIFAAGNWVAPDRPARVTGTVAPNGTHQFNFSFHGPTGKACVAGDHHEFFGMIQEGVAWFSDPGQGGPPDNQIEVWIKLVPAPPPPDMAHIPDLAKGPVDMAKGGGSGDMANGPNDDMAQGGGDDMASGEADALGTGNGTDDLGSEVFTDGGTGSTDDGGGEADGGGGEGEGADAGASGPRPTPASAVQGGCAVGARQPPAALGATLGLLVAAGFIARRPRRRRVR